MLGQTGSGRNTCKTVARSSAGLNFAERLIYMYADIWGFTKWHSSRCLMTNRELCKRHQLDTSYIPYPTGEKHTISTFVDQTCSQLTRRLYLQFWDMGVQEGSLIEHVRIFQELKIRCFFSFHPQSRLKHTSLFSLAQRNSPLKSAAFFFFVFSPYFISILSVPWFCSFFQLLPLFVFFYSVWLFYFRLPSSFSLNIIS